MKYRNLVCAWKSELLDEVIYMSTAFVCLLLVDEVTCCFNYNNFLQKWNLALEATIMNIFLDTWDMIGDVQIADNELNWYFDLYPSPRRRKLPGSATRNKKVHWCLRV